MDPNFQNIATSDAFKALAFEDQRVVTEEYFNEKFGNVLPSLSTEDRQIAFEEFTKENLPQPEAEPTTALNLVKSLGTGLAEGVTTELPHMVGSAIEFAGDKVLGEEVQSIGNSLKEWSEATRTHLFGPQKDRTGFNRWVYEGSKMLGPSLIPGGTVATGARALKGIGTLVKAAKSADAAGDAAKAARLWATANKAASTANKMGAATSAALFGASSAQQTIDTAHQRADLLERQGDIEGAQQLREVAAGITPFITGGIEAGGEYFGTKYLGKLLRLDEADILKRGTKNVVRDFLKTLGVEVGTETGQQLGQAGVEKVTGVRPDADPLAEALDVVGPTSFMTLLTGGLGAGLRMRKGDEAQPTSEDIKDLKSTEKDEGTFSDAADEKRKDIIDAVDDRVSGAYQEKQKIIDETVLDDDRVYDAQLRNQDEINQFVEAEKELGEYLNQVGMGQPRQFVQPVSDEQIDNEIEGIEQRREPQIPDVSRETPESDQQTDLSLDVGEAEPTLKPPQIKESELADFAKGWKKGTATWHASGGPYELSGVVKSGIIVHSARQKTGEKGWIVSDAETGETLTGTRAIDDQIAAKQIAQKIIDERVEVEPEMLPDELTTTAVPTRKAPPVTKSRDLTFFRHGKEVAVNTSDLQNYILDELGIRTTVDETNKGTLIKVQTPQSANALRKLFSDYDILSAQQGESNIQGLLIGKKKGVKKAPAEPPVSEDIAAVGGVEAEPSPQGLSEGDTFTSQSKIQKEPVTYIFNGKMPDQNRYLIENKETGETLDVDPEWFDSRKIKKMEYASKPPEAPEPKPAPKEPTVPEKVAPEPTEGESVESPPVSTEGLEKYTIEHEIEGTGTKARINAKKAYDNAVQRRDALNRFLDCLNG